MTIIPSLTVLCGLCVVYVRLRLLLVLVLGRRVCRVIGLEGQVLLVGGACKNVKEGFYKYILTKLHYETTFENLIGKPAGGESAQFFRKETTFQSDDSCMIMHDGRNSWI